MKEHVKITFNNVDTNDCYVDYDTVDTCPVCKSKIAPIYIASSLNEKNSISFFNFCRSCRNAFVTKYKIPEPSTVNGSHSYYKAKSIIYSEPNRYSKYEFDAKIVALSPQFDKIYNQSLAAETYGLDEIAGLGYRKSLEFLIKDFAIHENPDDAETIKAKPLVQCIKAYIDNSNIVTLAERSAWIGNDEAHYIRKQEERDVTDMKAFIQATAYFIGMILITEDAASMTPK